MTKIEMLSTPANKGNFKFSVYGQRKASHMAVAFIYIE